jgi:uncharacterized glyoxalase superfamily protein PhnB
MNRNRSVPTSTLLAHLYYRNLLEACNWLKRVFGFSEHFRYGDPVRGIQMYLGDAYIMLSEPGSRGNTPAALGQETQMLTLMLADVEAHYQHAKKEGAKIWEELQVTVYGEKQYGVEDLDGHRWLFSQHARDVDPREWGATIVSSPRDIVG